MDSDDPIAAQIERAVERRMRMLREDPEKLERYVHDGDSDVVDDQWDKIRQVVTLEVQTELQRRQQPAEQSSVDDEFLELLRDRYELRRELGRGAQGRTFVAYDRDEEEKVAVKELLIRDVEDWKAVELFEREGEALRHLDHPGIPGYVDAFHCDDGDGGERFFLVQEFVEGMDLETLVDEGKTFSEEEVREFLADIFEILIYLQDRSPPVIHRDIKPSNIMRRDDGGLALIDFGAVQSVIPQKTGGSTIIGTSGYMPVEQLMGRAEPATDLYAVGATVVHLLSHRHPADLPMKEMRLQFQDYVNISRPFQSFLERLLTPHVEERIATAEQALRDLRRLRAFDASPSLGSPRASAAAAPSPMRDVASPPDSRPANRRPVDKLFDFLEERDQGWRTDRKMLKEVSSPVLIVFCVLLALMFIAPFAIFCLGGTGALLLGHTAPDEREKCEDGDIMACMSWAADVKASDPDEAMQAYATGCEQGDGPMCMRQGTFALEHDEPELAMEALRTGCDLDEHNACAIFADRFEDEDPAEARSAATKACDLGQMTGCALSANHSLQRFESDPGDADDDLTRARVLADRSCDAQSESGCARLALVELYDGDVDAAMRTATRAVVINEQHPYPHKSLGLAAAAGGDVDGATESFRNALDHAEHPAGHERPHLEAPKKETLDAIVTRLQFLKTFYPEQADVLAEVQSSLGD